MKDNVLLRCFVVLGGGALVLAAILSFSYDIFENFRNYYVLAFLSTLLAFELQKKQVLRKSFYETQEYRQVYDNAVKNNIASSDIDKNLLVPYFNDLKISKLSKLAGVLSVFALAYFTGFFALYLISLSVVLNGYMLYTLYNTRNRK